MHLIQKSDEIRVLSNTIKILALSWLNIKSGSYFMNILCPFLIIWVVWRICMALMFVSCHWAVNCLWVYKEKLDCVVVNSVRLVFVHKFTLLNHKMGVHICMFWKKLFLTSHSFLLQEKVRMFASFKNTFFLLYDPWLLVLNFTDRLSSLSDNSWIPWSWNM